MDELDRRLAAVELLLVEIAPWVTPEIIGDARKSISEGLQVPVCEDEADIRLQALSLLDDGVRRFHPGVLGRWVRAGV